MLPWELALRSPASSVSVRLGQTLQVPELCGNSAKGGKFEATYWIPTALESPLRVYTRGPNTSVILSREFGPPQTRSATPSHKRHL